MARLISFSARAVLTLAAALATGCVAPDRGAAGTPALLYVANSLDGTVTRLDAQSGRVVGAALPAGPAPVRIVSASDGSLLVLSHEASRSATLTHVARDGSAGETWTTRPVPLAPRARHAHTAILAGDGAGHAVLVYDPPGADGPRLALVDMRTGTVARDHGLPAADETVLSAALEHTPSGPIAYLGMWRWQVTGGESGPSGAGPERILAVHAETGAVLASAPVNGAPVGLTLGPAPGRAGLRLYSVQQIPGRVRAEDPDAGFAPQSRELLGLDPATLEVQRAYPLDRHFRTPAVSPDGDHLYALALFPDVAATSLLHLDPAGGAVRRLAELPGIALDLAVTGERIYVPHAFGAEVWALDRRSGRLLQTIPVGRHPTAIAAGGASATAGSAG